MDELMKILKTGLDRIAEGVEQGVEDTHQHREVERLRRKKELMKKVLEKSVGRSEELEGPWEENQIGERGENVDVE